MQPLQVFIASAIFAALAGVAAMLRADKKITGVGIVSSLLNSGLLGLAISLLWFTRFQENLYFLIGVCIVAGLGGMTTIEMVLKMFAKGGFQIKIGKDGQVGLPPEKEQTNDQK